MNEPKPLPIETQLLIVERKINGQTVPTCSARRLHAFLGAGTRFTAWIQGRIGQQNLVANQDFIITTYRPKHIGRPGRDWQLTMEAAGLLSKTEVSNTSDQAYAYFQFHDQLHIRATEQQSVDAPFDLSAYASNMPTVVSKVDQVEPDSATVQWPPEDHDAMQAENDEEEKLPIVHIKDGGVYANSKDVAEFFGKRHHHVIRDIQDMEIPESYRKTNFGVSTYTTPGQTRKYLSYDMTRDGFTLIAMGYTGKKAMGFKIRYIEEFNRMERELKEGSSQISSADLSRIINQAVQTSEERVMQLAAKTTTAIVRELMPQLVEANLRDDPRVAVENRISAKEVLDQMGVGSKGRRGLIRHISRLLREFCEQHGEIPKRCVRTRTWLFPVHITNKWKRGPGQGCIENHYKVMGGQRTLPAMH